MKMVIVFDTEDRNGMENTIKMVEHLAAVYMGQSLHRANKRAFGKIEFIKCLRNFANAAVKEEEVDGNGYSLRFAKRFAEEIWRDKGGIR
tara:strand:- start:3504 stop:3773 length:270 start_codon:yes stop_codon:yes gene_type:complete